MKTLFTQIFARSKSGTPARSRESFQPILTQEEVEMLLRGFQEDVEGLEDVELPPHDARRLHARKARRYRSVFSSLRR